MKEVTINKINTVVNKIIDKVQKEYSALENFMANQTGAYVFENSYECSAKTDINYYFQNQGFSDYINNKLSHSDNDKLERMLHDLTEFEKDKNILDCIYVAHLNSDTLYTNSWENLNDLIKYLIFDEII